MPRKTRPPKGDGPKNYPWWLWNLKGPDYYRNKYPNTPIVQDPPIVNTTAPNPKILEATARVQREFLLNAAQAGMPEPYAYGHTVVKPLIVSADDTGANLILDLLWSAGEIEGFVEVAGDRFVYMPDIGYGIAEGSGFEHFTGAPGQSASTIMTALKGSYDTLAGKAHSVITMDLDWNLNLYGWIYGRKVTDPRVSPSFIYSENPALVLADVLSLCNYTLDWDSVANAANYCDELIGATSPQVPRWKLGGVIYDRHDLRFWIHTLAQYCSCYVDIQGGNYVYLVPDKPRSSTHTVTAADMVDGSVRVRRKGARDVPSRVEVTYGYGATGRSIAGYGTASGPGTTTQLQMPFFRGLRGDSLAYRKGEEVYRKAQADLECEFISFDDGLLLTLGDVGTITNANYGLSSQDMILVENEIVDRGRWRRKYIQYEPTAYVDTEYTISLNNVSLYNPYDPPDGPEPTLTYIGFGEASPQTQSCIQIEFSPLTWAYLKQYYITVTTTLDEETILYEEYINKGAETGSPLTITTQTDFAAALGTSPQTVYRVNVYIVSIVDALSTIPGTADITDPVAVYWNTDPLTVFDFRPYSGTSAATLEFSGSNTSLSNNSSARYTFGSQCSVIVPLVEGSFTAGEWLVKYDNITEIHGNDSDPLFDLNTTYQPGTWVEANNAKLRVLDQTANSPQREGQVYSAEVSIAQNNGSGAPVTSTIITKTVTFMAWADDAYLFYDLFTGTNGTDLTTHTPDVRPTSSPEIMWEALAGGFEIQSNAAVMSSASPTVTGMAVVDLLQSDAEWTCFVNLNSEDAGLVGRVQDASNYWQLIVEGAGTSDPVLKLNEVNSGTPTTRASVTMTGKGPITGGGRLFRLMFGGNDIVGQFAFRNTSSFAIASLDDWDSTFQVTYTSTSFNTATKFGIQCTGNAAAFDAVFMSEEEAQFITLF